NRTTFNLGLVFGHLQRFLRQFKDLPLLVPEHGLVAQGAASASSAGTTVQRVNLDVVGLGDGLERPTGPAWLATGSAPAFLAQRLGRGFGYAVTTGWFAAVAAVQSQARFELFDLAAQLAQLGLQAQ